MFFPGTIDVAIAFMACTLCGAIPVCVYPPDPRKLDHDVPIFERNALNCGAKVCITHAIIVYYD